MKKHLETIAIHHASSVPPFRFGASVPPKAIIFNREISTDLMWVNNKPVLHVVVTAIKFQNAVFFKSKYTKEVWKDFIEFWISVYIIFPEIIRLDRESSLPSENFRNNAKYVKLDIKRSGIKSHNANGQV